MLNASELRCRLCHRKWRSYGWFCCISWYRTPGGCKWQSCDIFWKYRNWGTGPRLLSGPQKEATHLGYWAWVLPMLFLLWKEFSHIWWKVSSKDWLGSLYWSTLMILVFSKTVDEHVRHVKEVLAILRQHKLYAKFAKCKFGKTELTFLGPLLVLNSLNPGDKADPRKVEVFQDWPTPKDMHNVRQFLGLTNYFRKFVQGYAAICRPMSALLGEGKEFAWTVNCVPVLALPDFSEFKLFEVIYAFGFGVGAVLTQKGRPIAFESRKLKDAEMSWRAGFACCASCLTNMVLLLGRELSRNCGDGSCTQHLAIARNIANIVQTASTMVRVLSRIQAKMGVPSR